MKLDKIKQLDATKKQKSTVGNANAKLIPPHSIIYEGSDKYTQFLEQIGTDQTAVSVEACISPKSLFGAPPVLEIPRKAGKSAAEHNREYQAQQRNNNKESALDTQVGGKHYKDLAIQPMEYSMLNNLNACQHTAIKYITRYKDKGDGLQDLIKAKHCIDLLIGFEYPQGDLK